jgi:hypothetical protein
MTAQPAFSLTAPAVITLAPDSQGTVRVLNSGTHALAIRTVLGRYTEHSLHYPAASGASLTQMGRPWLTITPTSFTIQPGQSETVRISDHVPAGTQGDHYLNTVFVARPAATGDGHPGTAQVSGGVATTVRIPDPGTAVAVTSAGLPRAQAVPHTSPAGNVAAAAGGLLALLAIVTAVLWELRRRRRARHGRRMGLADIMAEPQTPEPADVDSYGRWPRPAA